VASTEATGTRCAEKVHFGKRVKQEKIQREPSPQKGNEWSGGGLHLLCKICCKTKMGPLKISTPHPKFSQIWTGKNCEIGSQNTSHELSDAARQSRAPHAYIQIKTVCIMPDSSGAAKENWGKKSVSDENAHIRSRAKIDKSSPRRRKGEAVMLCRWFSLPNYYRGGGRKWQFLAHMH